MENPEEDLINFLIKLIEDNKDNFIDQGDFVVRPGIAYDRFDLTAVSGSYDMSLQGLVHHYLYEKGHYKKLLPGDEFKKCEDVAINDPESIYGPEDNESVQDTLDEIYNAALTAVGQKLISLKFEIPDEFTDILKQNGTIDE